MASLVKTDKISTTAGGAQEFTLPAADGTANQHLKTDGSGVLGWASPPTGVALTGSTNTWIPTITGADALAGTANFTYDGNTLDVKNSGTASSINLYCETGNAHYTKIKSGPHASATSYTITLPNKPPTANGQALTATTAGVASWASPTQVKVGEFNYIVDTASGTQAITGVGFQPIALWIFAGPDRGISPPPVWGGSDGTTHGNVASIHPTAAELWDANTANLIDIETSAGNTATAVVASFDADGFTLTWTKTGSPPTQTILINYWAVR